MPGDPSVESRSRRPITSKRPFADVQESNNSSLHPGSAKRSRLEPEAIEQFPKTIEQQPRPRSLKRPHASFLEDFVDPPYLNPAVKSYCPESVDNFVTQWLESGTEPEPYRQRHCRSDIILGRADDDLIPRRLMKSAPIMNRKKDGDGFTLPSSPTSIGSRMRRMDGELESVTSWQSTSIAPSNISSVSTSFSKKSLVEDPTYRDMNLTANNIYIRRVGEELPDSITSLLDEIRKDRDSPGPTTEELGQDTYLEELELGTSESQVERYFQSNIFPNPKPMVDILQNSVRLPMAKHSVPDLGSKLKVSTPVPDLLYGYTRNGAVHQQQAQFASLGNEMVANTNGLVYPFFVIEFKADGPSGNGSMWVATNQCLGASASCINIAERLNSRLRQCKSSKVKAIDSTTFSIAMNGTEARLFVSWRHDDLLYYMQKVDSFLMQKPRDYVEFRKYVRNIIDWGEDKRLKMIRDSLNTLLEESRKTASQTAKSRPPPSSNHSSGSGSQKRRSSSSRRSNSSTSTAQDRSGVLEEPHWKWNTTHNRHFHIDLDGNLTWAEEEGQSSSGLQ